MLICKALLGGTEKHARHRGTASTLAFSSHYIIGSQSLMSYFSLSECVLTPGVDVAAKAGATHSLCGGTLLDFVCFQIIWAEKKTKEVTVNAQAFPICQKLNEHLKKNLYILCNRSVSADGDLGESGSPVP